MNADLLVQLQPGERFHPNTIPLHLVDRLVPAYGLKLFVETGTYLGFTVEHVHELFEEVVTIELDAKLAQAATQKFAQFKNVRVWQCDSGTGLVDALAIAMFRDLRALIWLDAHYSGGVTTGRGEEVDTPIRKELAALAHAQGRHDHVIMIDDIVDFNGERGYPTFEELRSLLFQINPAYTVTLLPIRRGVVVALPPETP